MLYLPVLLLLQSTCIRTLDRLGKLLIYIIILLKARSHRGDAWGSHGQRIENLQFGPVRCRSLGVRHHALLVRRARWANAGPALDQRYAFVVIRCVRRVYLSMLKSVRGARRMDVHAKGTPDMRGTR